MMVYKIHRASVARNLLLKTLAHRCLRGSLWSDVMLKKLLYFSLPPESLNYGNGANDFFLVIVKIRIVSLDILHHFDFHSP